MLQLVLLVQSQLLPRRQSRRQRFQPRRGVSTSVVVSSSGVYVLVARLAGMTAAARGAPAIVYYTTATATAAATVLPLPLPRRWSRQYAGVKSPAPLSLSLSLLRVKRLLLLGRYITGTIIILRWKIASSTITVTIPIPIRVAIEPRGAGVRPRGDLRLRLSQGQGQVAVAVAAGAAWSTWKRVRERGEPKIRLSAA